VQRCACLLGVCAEPGPPAVARPFAPGWHPVPNDGGIATPGGQGAAGGMAEVGSCPRVARQRAGAAGSEGDRQRLITPLEKWRARLSVKLWLLPRGESLLA